jgi:hypothetical protein
MEASLLHRLLSATVVSHKFVQLPATQANCP